MRRFHFKLALYFLPFAAILGLPLVVFVRAGELVSVDTVIDRQAHSETTLLYGPAYSNPDKLYKFRGTVRRRPSVLALGSSRVMQLRASFFRAPSEFWNAGGAVNKAKHFRRFLEDLPPEARPKLVVIGLDAWYFNPHYEDLVDDDADHQFTAEDGPLNTTQRKWLTVYRDCFIDHKITAKGLFASRDYPAVGLNALLNQNGFRNDGSYSYGSRIVAPDGEFPDRAFAETRARMEAGRGKMEPAGAPLAGAVDEIGVLLETCRRLGITVVGFLPPYPPSIARRLLSSNRWAYLTRLRPILEPLFQREGFSLFDFTDVSALGATDDEFIDGFHGSEKTYLRLLIAMAQQVPVLAERVDVEKLRARLARSSARFEVAE